MGPRLYRLLFQYPFHPRVTTMTRKRPRTFCQKCRCRLHLNMHTPLTQRSWSGADYATVQAKCGNLSENELTRNSSGNTWPQSSQLAEPLWTDPGLRNGISVCNLISTLKKKRRQGINCWTFSPNPHTHAPPPPPSWDWYACLRANKDCSQLHSVKRNRGRFKENIQCT